MAMTLGAGWRVVGKSATLRFDLKSVCHRESHASEIRGGDKVPRKAARANVIDTRTANRHRWVGAKCTKAYERTIV
jgi:hypothetical protein